MTDAELISVARQAVVLGSDVGWWRDSLNARAERYQRAANALIDASQELALIEDLKPKPEAR